MDKRDIVPIIISIVYGSKALAQKLTSNTELTRSHNVNNLLQHTALNTNLRQSRPLFAISEKHLASKDGNPLGSDTAPKGGNPFESEPAIRKRKSRSGSSKEKNNSKRRK